MGKAMLETITKSSSAKYEQLYQVASKSPSVSNWLKASAAAMNNEDHHKCRMKAFECQRKERQ